MNLYQRIFAGFFLVLVISVLSLGWYLSNGKDLQSWHAPADFNEPFDYANSSFEDYISWSQRRILASRTDSPSAEEVANLLPFILEPDSDCPINPDGKYTDGIVLIHGLIASPWSMNPLAQYFNSRCFYVLSVLLPGHGTRPGDMLEVTWEQWQQTVSFASRQLAEKTERVFLTGHSAGGTLAVLEAAQNPQVDALILFAPAMQVSQASKYAGLISKLGKLFPGAAWFELEPDDVVYRYESFPFSAAAETWSLIQTTQKALAAKPLSIPIFTVASAQDTTVDVQATFDFMASQNNPLSYTLLYSQFNLPPYNRTQIVKSAVPDLNILSLGHLGLMTPPDHPFYGLQGEYRYCGHYYGEQNNVFASCKAGERDFYGETTELNLQSGIIERIAFNPFYDQLLVEIDLFLEQVSMDQKGIPLPRLLERRPLE